VIYRLAREQVVAAAPAEVFEFFSRARNLETLTPPWLRFEVVSTEPIEMCHGTRIEYRLRLHGVPLRWVSRIEEWHPGRGFVDRQVRGPYRLWHHRHEFEPHRGGTLVRDIVHYSLPLGPLGALAHTAFVRRDLEAVFEYRQRQIERLACGELLAA
jgi:ligand-binding SRPBCC domain-containing protein